MLANKDIVVSFFTNAAPAEVKECIHRPDLWWVPQLKGSCTNVGDKFAIGDGESEVQLQVVESTYYRVVWNVLRGGLASDSDFSEWNATSIVFDLKQESLGTEVFLTHKGLTPDMNSYKATSDLWAFNFGGKLKELIREKGSTSTTNEPEHLDFLNKEPD